MAQTFFCPEHLLTNPINVTLVGAGGTGGELLEGLVRLHFGLLGCGHPHGVRVQVHDPDAVSPSNIGRQKFYPGDEGWSKAHLLIHRINMAFGLEWAASTTPLPVDDSPALPHSDLLITAVDKAQVRAAIAQKAGSVRSRGFGPSPAPLWLDTGNGRHTGQVVLGHLGQPEGPRLPHVVDLYPELDGMDDSDEPSCSLEQALREQDLFINRTVADSALALLWDLLRDGQIQRHGAHLDVKAGRTSPLPIDPTTWAFFGFEADANGWAVAEAA